MKSFKINHWQFHYVIVIMALSLFSCRKNIDNEVKINDFASLSVEFKQPSKEYTTAPFFVWNYKITKEEIDKYMNDFKRSGSSQVFVHPRPGLITEYLSNEWFDLFKYTVDKGKELGMNVWIYDENSYPSGFAGGHVPFNMPESFNQGQGLRMIRTESIPDTADKFFICLKENEGKFTDITSVINEEKGKSGSYLLFFKTYNGKSDWYGGFSYVDLLYEGVTQKFLDITMKGYKKYTGNEFGKVVPGIFTDEPQINSSGGIRWTPDLFSIFQEKWNYDLKTCLPSLYEDVGDWMKVRHNYTMTLLDLFIERWAKPYFRYCESNGLKFTGHYWEHEWPNMRPGGDNMAMYAWHQVPAIDMLFNQWNDSTPRAQFGNVRAVKELASAANQTGRQRKLSETYGGAGWDLTFTDMKRNGDWEYALGVNLMNQHLSHITLAGARKYDYPLTFTYHEPWWEDYKYLNDHYARLSLALSAGKQVNDVLVLEPTTSAWLYDSYVKRNPKVTEIGQAFQTFITKLEKEQVEYDLGSENIIRSLGSIQDGKFKVGDCLYSVVVLPPLMENLDSSTFKLLEQFVTNDGKLLAFSLPSMVDGTHSENLRQFFSDNSDKIVTKQNLTSAIIREFLSDNDISFTDMTGGDLYHHKRTLSDGQLLFLTNSSLEKPVKGLVKVKGSDAVELNTLTGEIYGYQNLQDGDFINFSYDLPPAGSLLLFIPFIKQGNFVLPSKPDSYETIPELSPLSISRERENAVAIEFCDILAGGELVEDLHTYYAADKAFKIHGFKNGNPWNTSVQFKTRTVDRDTFGLNTGFTALYHFSVEGNFDFTSFKAVIERPELWVVEVNGTGISNEAGKWWLDRSFGVFDIGPLVKNGDNTISLKVSPMKIHAEIEPVYITGDFSVNPAKKGFNIGPPVKTLLPGSWKEQGMPFYSWGVIYSKEYNVDKPEGKYFIKLGEWNGTIAEININGQKAPLVAFPPYQSEVSDLIKAGNNKIEVKIIGSLKNLLGPHFNDPSPGFVSPGSWRNVRTYPPGTDYQILDYGLFNDFELVHAN